MADAFDETLRTEGARILASLVRWTRDLDLAEEALAEATVQALERLDPSVDPQHLAAWLLTTARHRAIDRIRRERTRGEKEVAAVQLLTSDPPQGTDPLRLIFTCCHPSLSRDAQVALSLRTLAGLTTAEIGRAFLAPEATIAQRITRAKRKIAHARIPYRVPPDHELPDRLDAVLGVLYLVYTTGHHAPTGQVGDRVDLANEAIRLTRLLVSLMPDESEALGLLALMLATEARRDARLSVGNSPVALPLQDRNRWDTSLIDEASDLVGRALGPTRHGPYAIQAAIACLHSTAATWEETDWPQIAYLYGVLDRLHPTPVVRVNRAIAEAEVFGPTAGLVLLDHLDGADGVHGWHLYWATRGDLYERDGRPDEAIACFRRALALDMNDDDRARFSARLAAIDRP